MIRNDISPFITFTRPEWTKLRDNTPLTLTEGDLETLRGINEHLSMREVEEVYLPLSRLLNLYLNASRRLYEARNTFLGNRDGRVPYIVGLAGSVAVGKSTTARILQALLRRWPGTPEVDIVATDGFLYPNSVLMEKGIMDRKGFPESYNVRELLKFLFDVKSGKEEVKVPVYSHLTYDIVKGEEQIIRRPDIIILEGLNVLQTSKGTGYRDAPELFVSDFFDFSIYVDAKEEDIMQWYLDRFLVLKETAFRDSRSFFHRYSDFSMGEALERATQIWNSINGPNLKNNISPTKYHAHLILEKGPSHEVRTISLRKI